ncbi:MAG: PD-(D/E)XK nuclease family protein [Methanomassiliicoccaceae archaeon]|nr:PD-(D/E)XK nuclease family protein [Methanomassiliicoccaceae archaeon]
MKVAKTIDELYDESKRYDIVISNDAALVTALNNRIDAPRIGRLASTPRMIAKDREDAILEKLMSEGRCTRDGRYGIMDDVRILDLITKATKHDIRFVHGEVENIRLIRRYRKDVEKYLAGRSSREIYRIYTELPTYELVMASFDPSEHHTYDGKKVAVIGIELFDDLDKHFIPMDFDDISLFKENGRYDIGTVYAVGNDRQVAEHAVDMIAGRSTEDVAIVMDTQGAISDAVRSALYRKGIGFKNTLSARDLIDVRDFMEFVTRSLSYEILTVGDVRELFACYGVWMDSRFDEYLLDRHARISKDGAKALSEKMKNIREHTFSELCGAIVGKGANGTVNMIFGELGLGDELINERTAGHASYLINSMDGIKHNAQIPDNERRGVLLTDCRNSAFIDRPFVIYVNMDGAWSGSAAGESYIDRAEEDEKERQRFQILLQQGSVRMHLVNTMKGGKEARPCTLFDRLNTDADGVMRKVSSFGDLVNTTVVRGAWCSPGAPPANDRHPAGGTDGDIRRFSKSTMNLYVTCPMAYMFGELVGPPDTEGIVFGNMVHEFAEFCLCYPDIARTNIETCTDILADAWAGISCPEKRELDRSRIRVSMTNVSRFIDSLNIAVQLTDAPKGRRNPFFEHFGKDQRTDIMERSCRSDATPLEGRFDLLYGNRIIDYKSGRPYNVDDIAKKMDASKKNDYYELQPFVYLSILDDMLGGTGKKEFIQFYTTDNDVESANDPDFNIMKNARTISLLSREDIVRNGTVLRMVCTRKTSDIITELGSRFGSALLAAGVGNPERWAGDTELFERIMAMHGKRTKAAREETEKVIRDSAKLLMRCFIVIDDENRIIIPGESIGRFKEYARKIHKRANEQQHSGFPYTPRKGCDRCYFRQICTRGGDDDESE